MEREAEVQFAIIQQGNASIGVDIMDISGLNFMARTAKYSPKKVNACSAILKASTYQIVPNTFQAGVIAPFILRVYVKKPIKFSLKLRQEKKK